PVQGQEQDYGNVNNSCHSRHSTRHLLEMARSSELAQASRSESTGDSITTRPLSSMRKVSARMTLPISRAATLYCLAVSRTAASFDGVTVTMARAPLSLKRAASAGSESSGRFAIAPRTEKADSSLRSE